MGMSFVLGGFLGCVTLSFSERLQKVVLMPPNNNWPTEWATTTATRTAGFCHRQQESCCQGFCWVPRSCWVKPSAKRANTRYERSRYPISSNKAYSSFLPVLELTPSHPSHSNAIQPSTHPFMHCAVLKYFPDFSARWWKLQSSSFRWRVLGKEYAHCIRGWTKLKTSFLCWFLEFNRFTILQKGWRNSIIRVQNRKILGFLGPFKLIPFTNIISLY